MCDVTLAIFSGAAALSLLEKIRLSFFKEILSMSESSPDLPLISLIPSPLPALVPAQIPEDTAFQLRRRIEDIMTPIADALGAMARRFFSWLDRHVQKLFSDDKPHTRKRPRNTRVQMVQAKRKRLNLDQDGKYPGLRSRKASYAFAMEVERWCLNQRDDIPRHADFDHVPARRRRRDARRVLRWRSTSDSLDKAWMDALNASTCEICKAFAIGAPEVSPPVFSSGLDSLTAQFQVNPSTLDQPQEGDHA